MTAGAKGCAGGPGNADQHRPAHHFSVGQYGSMCPITAFRRSYPSVTRLEKERAATRLPTDIVNKRETQAAPQAPTLLGNATVAPAATGAAGSRRQASARDDSPGRRHSLRRRGGLVSGSPRDLRPFARGLRVGDDPQHDRRRHAAPVRTSGAPHVPPRVPAPRPAVAADAAAVPGGGAELIGPAGFSFAAPPAGR